MDISSHAKKELLIDALRDRAKTLVEFANLAKQILEAPTCYDEKAVEKFLTADGLGVLEHYFEALKNVNSLSNAKVILKHLPKHFRRAWFRNLKCNTSNSYCDGRQFCRPFYF